MPGLLTRTSESGDAPANSGSGIWSRHRDSITFDQLQKFWRDLPLEKRQQLLRLDKQTLFEQVRKNLYCSRCNGLLLEGFSQIIVHGKSLHQEGDLQLSDTTPLSHLRNDQELDQTQDPSVHPWGGLTTTKDGFLTVLDCFICARSLRILQNVFHCARAREHEREMLYPDACGGEGRGWTSQGMVSYGRGYGTRETCALHTARLSCDTLVDFWSALGEETRSSLLRMKEEDFIERLMYRFDSKRFCRDCRRNVIREFKELKELKRMRREPRCTSWFCVADSAFLYEVSEDTVQADWRQSFTDTVGLYHHFEWAIGTAEGKADILDFEDVGINGKAQVNGLDLGGLNACFVTLRAWRLDGRCTELCVKAHALKGQQCVHRRLIIRDGFVTITKGESVRRFFEHAEETEEEEEDDGVDKDGNELDGDVSRPQKHAKSPELAREFLLDAATVIFKEQVEKAFREGTARQNAHSIFVSLALKLLEERLHVACKEIITLEKQAKLLEEEEKEKHEEEKRKERKKTKEREKKLRRKERLKGKEKDQEMKLMESHLLNDALSRSVNALPMITLDELPNTPDYGDTISEPDASLLNSPDYPNELPLSESLNLKDSMIQNRCNPVQEFSVRGLDSSLVVEHTRPLKQKLRFEHDSTLDCYDKRHSCLSNGYDDLLEDSNAANSYSRGNSGLYRSSEERFVKNNGRKFGMKFNGRFHSSQTTVRDRYEPHFCRCNSHGNYRAGDGHGVPTFRSGRGTKVPNRVECSAEMPKSLYHSVKHNDYHLTNKDVISKGKRFGVSPSKEFPHTKLVWEPLDERKKCSRNNSDSTISIRTTVDPSSLGSNYRKPETESQQTLEILKSADSLCSSDYSSKSSKVNSLTSSQAQEDMDGVKRSEFCGHSGPQDGFVLITKSDCYSENGPNKEVDCHIKINDSNTFTGSSSSDNCSCLSEVDSSTSFSSAQNAESSSASDSEDANHQLNCRNSILSSGSNGKLQNESPRDNCSLNSGDYFTRNLAEIPVSSPEPDHSIESHDGRRRFGLALPQEHTMNMQNHGMHVPVFPPQSVSYYHQGPASWLDSAAGFYPMPQVNHFVFPVPISYGIQPKESSDFSMHFTHVQPLSAPKFDPRIHSIHQMTSRVDPISSKEPFSHISSSELQQHNTVVEPIGSQRFHEMTFSNRQLTSKPVSAAETYEAHNVPKSQDAGSAFSLFHYGGPLAGLAAGSLVTREESRGGAISQLPTYACSKEETRIQEYSLFSARNGARFSFF